jgi:DNA invertase Pin-like site-specific DNA recombinase
MKVGYARVSSYGQSLEVQHQGLTAAGCERVFAEKISGRSADAREELKRCLEFVREGDTLYITKLDRLARSTRDLLNIATALQAKGVSLVVLDQQIDTGSATGRLLFTMIGAIAEFENDLRRDRQSAGVALAREKGVRFGRRRCLSEGEVHDLRARRSGGTQITELMKTYGISKASAYRYLTQDPH